MSVILAPDVIGSIQFRAPYPFTEFSISLVRSRWKVAYNHHKAGVTMTAAMSTTIAVALRTRLFAIRDLDPHFMAQEELICLAEVLKPSA